MSRRPWHRRFHGDYAADTAHLTMLQDSAYNRLLNYAYGTGKAITDEQANRIAGAQTDEERAAVKSVLHEFWFRDDTGGWRQQRVVKEQAISDIRKQSGSKGGSKRQANAKQKESKPTSPPTGARDPDPDPDPDLDLDPEQEFNEFWSAYPRKDSKLDARKAWGQTADARPDLAELLKILATHANTQQWRESRRFIPLPATWLRKHRWLDEVETESADLGGWEQTLDALEEP